MSGAGAPPKKRKLTPAQLRGLEAMVAYLAKRPGHNKGSAAADLVRRMAFLERVRGVHQRTTTVMRGDLTVKNTRLFLRVLAHKAGCSRLGPRDLCVAALRRIAKEAA